MRTDKLSLRAGCGLLLALGATIASAQNVPEPETSAAQAARPAPGFGSPATAYAGTREFVWTFLVPVLTIERVDVVTRVLAPHVRSRRLDYELPGLKSERYKLGQVAEFSCKYMDWQLPQQCRTVWRNVYADLPALTMERNHVDFDEARWVWEERTLRINVPHWTWTERTLTVSVPAFNAADTGRVLATLDAQQAAAAQAIDAAIVALDTSIAAVEEQGADPQQVSTRSGTTLDLAAMRQTLREGKASEFGQLEHIRAELGNLAAVAAPTAAP
ncbi:MAG TPA: hypothetical protein VG429_02405 [Casimicrobiaceae bacterium]|jgi:hypothetical protein|nr:hypothetical protein [Casimicrobiaceae bacterium]